MKKVQFLSELQKKLAPLSQAEIDRFLAYYDEILNDRMEEGMTEEEAIQCLESVDTIVEQILNEVPAAAIAPSAGKRSRNGWSLFFAIIGAPIWLPLTLAVFATVFALILSAWAVMISLFAAVACLLLSGIAVGIACIFILSLHPQSALFMLGMGLILAGISLLLLPGLTFLAKELAHFNRWTVQKIRICIRKRRLPQ